VSQPQRSSSSSSSCTNSTSSRALQYSMLQLQLLCTSLASLHSCWQHRDSN
jgi:hypothetical protein